MQEKAPFTIDMTTAAAPHGHNGGHASDCASVHVSGLAGSDSGGQISGSHPVAPFVREEHVKTDLHWMSIALQQARAAMDQGEVPVGAVLLSPQGDLLAAAGNAPIALNDPTAHAEISVLREAGRRLGNYRLTGCTLYVTLEPCPMCMSAIALSRVARVVYGARDDRLGACGSALNLAGEALLNPHTQVEGGLLADESATLLKTFFEARRTPKAQRLQRIERLEDLPNVDPALAAWLRQQGFEKPADLSVLAHDTEGLQGGDGSDAAPHQASVSALGVSALGVSALGVSALGVSAGAALNAAFNAAFAADAERRARWQALLQFVKGGPAVGWRSLFAAAQEQDTPS